MIIISRIQKGHRPRLDAHSRLATTTARKLTARRSWRAVTRRGREAELARVGQAIAQIVDAIADGMYHPSMKEKMSALEERRTAIEAELASLGDEEPLRLHPGLSAVYRRKAADLTTALNAGETARQAGQYSIAQAGGSRAGEGSGR